MNLSNENQISKILQEKEEIDNLINEITYLKEILASKIFEESHLINYICKQIKTDYSLKFGVYEYKIKEYQIKIKKTKRTIELINKEINNNLNNNFDNSKKVDLKEIENHIKNEFKEEDNDLEEEIGRANINIEAYKIESENKPPYNELNKIYKECIRKIHPDILFNATEYEENLFVNSKEAYEDKDLEELKATNRLINMHKINNLPKTIDDLEKFSRKLEIHIELIEKDISNITKSKQYKQQKFLLNQQKINRYREELVKSLLKLEKEYIEIKKKLDKIKKENNLT